MKKIELFNQYKNVVYKIYNDRFTRIPSNEHIKDDIIQEGLIALWKACQNYDESRGIKFITYAYKGVYNSMMCYASRHHKRERCIVSIEMSIREDRDGSVMTYSDIIASSDNSIEDYEINDIINQVISTMDDTAKIVCNKIREGYSQREIAVMLNTTQPQVSRVLKKLKSKLKILIMENK